jgi:hypothetical protein
LANFSPFLINSILDQMKLSAQMTGLSDWIDAEDIKARMARMMRTMGHGRDRLKERLRDQLAGRWLFRAHGEDLAGHGLPQDGSSLNPAAYVWSKAPGIIDAYARGVTIVAKAGRRLLAIPTQEVPRKRQGNALTPLEVERRYGKRLRFVPAKDFKRSAGGRGAVAYLILDGLVRATAASTTGTPRPESCGSQARARPSMSDRS